MMCCRQSRTGDEKIQSVKHRRRRSVLSVSALAVWVVLYFAAQADAAFQSLKPYPSEDSVILNPFDPSDDSALLLSILQPYYKAATGRAFSIRSMPGRGGATAWIDLSGRGDDAYNLALTDLPNLVLLSLAEYPMYNLRDMRNICLLASMPLVLWVHQASPARDLYDLVDSAGARPEQVSIAGLGRGTIQHLATLRFNRMAGVKFSFSPYTGVESSGRAVLEGKKQAFWGYPSAALAKTGNYRPLAIASERRHALFPDLPTFMELGYGLLESSYFGLAVSARTRSQVSVSVGTTFLSLAVEQSFQKEIGAAGFIPAPVGAFDLNGYLQRLLEYYARQKEEYGME
jgi:tripartite-type tricarboxylate transporter receptor subunit TctC